MVFACFMQHFIMPFKVCCAWINVYAILTRLLTPVFITTHSSLLPPDPSTMILQLQTIFVGDQWENHLLKAAPTSASSRDPSFVDRIILYLYKYYIDFVWVFLVSLMQLSEIKLLNWSVQHWKMTILLKSRMIFLACLLCTLNRFLLYATYVFV